MSVPERVETGVVVLRRRREADSPAMVEMIAGSLDHLSPWMGWLADGFDPSKVKDPIYFRNPAKKAYVKLTKATYAKIREGGFKL